jgi:branched-chain amino acid transport system ATP-binding protein
VAVLVQGKKLVEGTSDVVQGDERVIAAYLGTPYEGAAGSNVDGTNPELPEEDQ